MNIKQTDIDLINELEAYSYKKSMNGVVSPEKQKEFKELKKRLSALSSLYKKKYDATDGIFVAETATGNPISFHGNLRRVWSGIFKGSENKQYSAQISFVINTKDNCLDVGFYFGRASSFNVEKDKLEIWEKELSELGGLLHTKINASIDLQKVYYSLFEFGFKGEIKGKRATADEWLQNLTNDPTHSSIVFNLKPGDSGEVEFSNVDLYVAMLLPLISVLPEKISSLESSATRRKIKSLSPEQRAKQAERRALIGLDGEKFIMTLENARLNSGGNVDPKAYPIHKSLISDGYGYDILSIDNDHNELFIEVKTTTLMKGEERAKIFYLSTEEYKFYEKNIDKYRLYRVYDIYGSPHFETLNLSEITKHVDGYRFEIS
jgi:hypothetical protein